MACMLRHAAADASPLNRVSVVMKYVTILSSLILQKAYNACDHHWRVAIPLPFLFLLQYTYTQLSGQLLPL